MPNFPRFPLNAKKEEKCHPYDLNAKAAKLLSDMKYEDQNA
jgi:hypothetical protein